MPKLNRVLETALYVADLDRSAAFYGVVLGHPCIREDHRMRAMTLAEMAFSYCFRKACLFNPSRPLVDRSRRMTVKGRCILPSRFRPMNWRSGNGT
jgi:hypothetical protein